ncbi:MAG: site-specific DNA-methyltransferase [Bryobacteraceae bacterium]|nr:site-specific DNA-methyltransferase [Bryobacteraceae bacterium]
MLTSTLRIEYWTLDRLVPYTNNARTHSDHQVAQIVASIREFGFTNPILVDTEAGILAGHARLLAAGCLHLAQVPVIVLDHLTDGQKRAYILADNKLALNAGWDEELLAQELAALEKAEFDLSLIGFSEEELVALLADEQTDKDEDAAPETPTVPISRPGDLWLLGPHRVLCGDATDASAVGTLMAGSRADMVFTDPPYNVNYGQAAGRRILNDNLGDGFGAFLRLACVNLLEVTAGAVYICMSSSELHTLHQAFTQAGGHWSTFVIWAKNTFTLGRSDYQRQYEPILYGWKQGGDHYWCGDRDQGDVWLVDKPFHNDLHPTMKPVELVERAIRNSTVSGGIVLDPFGGSGSTLIACHKAGRRARILEVEPKYVDVIVRRWQEFTGKQAVREGDGRSL